MKDSTRRVTALVSFLVVAALPVALRAEGASIDEASKSQLKRATELYELGLDALDADNAAAALTHFQQSLDTVNSPNCRMMVGRALVKLGKFPEAYRVLSKSVQDAKILAQTQKKYKKTIESGQRELDEIKDKVAYVTIQSGERVVLDGQPLSPADWEVPIAVAQGTVRAEVTHVNGNKEDRVLTLKAGERSTLSLAPQAVTSVAAPVVQSSQAGAPCDSPRPGPKSIDRRTVGYIIGSVGLVGVGAFVGFGIVGASSYGNTKASCVAQNCPESSVNQQGDKSLLQGIGFAGLGVGVLGLAAGTWLILTGGDVAPRSSLNVGASGVQFQQRF